MLDVHAHILPGVDDGPATMDEAMVLLHGLKGLGFSTVVATPHYRPGLFAPTFPAVENALKNLRLRTKEEGLSLDLIRGREVFLDYSALTSPDRATFPFSWQGKKYQLIEIADGTLKETISAYVAHLGDEQIRPILAHVERLDSVCKEPKRAQEFSELGFLIQVDLASLSSGVHPRIQKTAQTLLKQGFVDVLASDLHHAGQLPAMREGLDAIQALKGAKETEKYFAL